MAAQPLWDLASEEARPKLKAAIQHTFHPGIAQAITVEFPGPAGRKWYRIQGIPAGDAVEPATILHCIDVSQQEKELERLHDSERLMRDGEGMAHLGTWYWDITEPHAEWSDGLYQIYGLDPETHIPTYEDYLTRIHEDDVERVKYATERVFQDFESYSHDERIRHADGTWRHLHTWARPVLKSDGSLKALQGVCLDITQRKESELALAAAESRQRLILDYAGLGISSVRPDGAVEQANTTFDKLTGLGQNLSSRFENGAEIDAAIEDLNAHKARTRTLNATPTGVPGHHVRLLLTRVDEGEKPFLVAVAQDVTAEVLALEADAKIRDLEARQASQARVVGMAGHELKNPLTPILMQLTLLERGRLGPLDDVQHAALAKIHTQTERIQVLLQDLLDTSKAEAGVMQMETTDVDVAQLVKTATDTHQATAESFGVVLVSHGPDHVQAKADASRIVQVVDNLVVNAIRFTPSGSRVDVTIRDEGQQWTLEVADEGMGIPADQQGDIFSAFVRGDTPAVHDLKSSGLGLFVVRGIVEAHGGTVTLESSREHGTTLTATMPK